jgi:putative PIN family toxin of toxin-antitoxin system
MEKTAKIRVILDTNILVSWLINPVLADLDNWLYSEKIELAFSAELLQEFVDVTNRPKLRKYFKSRNADDILMLIREHVVFVDVKSIVEACRDPKDNFLLALASDAHAAYLLTGDKDLLVLGKYGNTIITTWADFIKRQTT